jgi:hypothetical protein
MASVPHEFVILSAAKDLLFLLMQKKEAAPSLRSG